MTAVEGRQGGGQQVGADGVAGADGKLASFEVGEFAHRALGSLVEPEDAFCESQQHLSGLGQAHPTRETVKQWHTETFLEDAELA
jgi:hypothetical protein